MEKIFEQLDVLVKKIGSYNKVVKMLPMSAATLSALRNGTYTSKDAKLKDKHIAAIKDLLSKEQARVEDEIGRTIFPFRKTVNSQIFFEVAWLCEKYCEIGVVTGIQGLGKTRSAKQYKIDHSSTVVIHVRPSFTTKIFVRKLYEALGGTKTVETDGMVNARARKQKNAPLGVDGMVDFCVEKLNGSKKLLIVDQVEYLSDKAIDILRTIHDECLDENDNGTIGILMTGLPELLSKLKQFPQFYQRISWFRKLGTYDNQGEYRKGLSDDDIKSFVETVFLHEQDKIKKFDELTNGNPRVLKKLIDRSRRLCQLYKCELSEKIIKEATQTIMLR
jgi:DNA transposition AAA+ family ATPase